MMTASTEQADLAATIQQIKHFCEDQSSRSQFCRWGSQAYKDSVRHFVASSSDVALAAVRPGNVQDLSEIMKIIASSGVPFAVRGGGHAMVPNFSSTKGIQIAMSHFNNITYNEADQTVDVGAGCLWDEVYGFMAPLGRNVVGGYAAEGVGIGGYLLGGGYSLKSSQFGLGIDNILKFEVVLTDGRVLSVTADDEEHEDLFQALRGGGNNFGIVTKFTLKTHPQGDTYGASLVIPGQKTKELIDAVVDFDENEKRPQAAILIAFRHTLPQGVLDYHITSLCVFDAPKPQNEGDVPFKKFRELVQANWGPDPAGWVVGKGLPVLAAIGPNEFRYTGNVPMDARHEDYGFSEKSFEDFNQLSSHAYDIGGNPAAIALASGVDLEAALQDEVTLTSTTQTAQSTARVSVGTVLKTSAISTGPPSMKYIGEVGRGRFGCFEISRYTRKVIEKMVEESARCGSYLKSHNGTLVHISIKHFQSCIFDGSPPGAAWPHKKGDPHMPLLAWFIWENADDDAFWLQQMQSSLDNIRRVAVEDGVASDTLPYYSNTSLETVPVEWIYRENLKELGKVRAKYDPRNVMGNTGGFKIPLVKA